LTFDELKKVLESFNLLASLNLAQELSLKTPSILDSFTIIAIRTICSQNEEKNTRISNSPNSKLGFLTSQLKFYLKNSTKKDLKLIKSNLIGKFFSDASK